MLLAVQCCHKNNIILRDIKLDNFMTKANNNRDQIKVKLTNVKMACQYDSNQPPFNTYGNLITIAPEMLIRNTYGPSVDVWSLGVCLYQLLTGVMPFDGNSMDQLFDEIRERDYPKPRRLSQECQDLISKMLKKDPS